MGKTLLSRMRAGFAAATLAITTLTGAIVPSLSAYAVTANTCVWAGGTDTNFNTAANWTSCGSTVPHAGDIISFPTGTASTVVTLTNNLVGNPALGGIYFGATSGSGSMTYVLSALHLGDGATIKRAGAHIQVNISGALTADGALTLDGGGASGGIGNDFQPTSQDQSISVTNLTVLNSLQGCSGGGYYYDFVPSGILTIGTGSTYGLHGAESSVIVQGGGELATYSNAPSTYAGSITFQGGGSSQFTPSCGAGQDSLAITKSITLSGTITLSNGDVNYNISNGQTLTITGTIQGAGYKLINSTDPYSTGTFVNNASTNNSSTPGGSQTVPVTTEPPVTDSQPSTYLAVAPKTIVTLDGTRGNVNVAGDGTLKGTGTAQSLYVNQGGIVAPGHSPGKLTVLQTLTLSAGSIYQAELKDTAAGDYDQIQVGDPSQTTGNAVTLGDTNGLPTLQTILYTGYSIKAGDQFTIINNLSKTAVLGTFQGLPEGTKFAGPNGSMFQISYVGGDGNDVVLTVLTAPTAPKTGLALVLANPIAVLAGGIIAAAALILIGRKLARR